LKSPFSTLFWTNQPVEKRRRALVDATNPVESKHRNVPASAFRRETHDMKLIRAASSLWCKTTIKFFHHGMTAVCMHLGKRPMLTRNSELTGRSNWIVGTAFIRTMTTVSLLFLFISGCADKVGGPVNSNLALQTLEMVLESWKEGSAPEELLKQSSPIIVQETEWTDENKLVDYEVLDGETSSGPNLVATVKLKLSKADGAITEKTATYLVTTSPKLTVYRNMMR
jgi:hypothetical protein